MINKDVILKMTEFFLKRCKDGRIAAGKSLKDVANDLGFSYQNIQKFEAGENNSLTIAYYYMKNFHVEV